MRRHGLLLMLVLLTPVASALEGLAPEQPQVQLDAEQSQRFRAWFTRIIDEQVRRPSPRWVTVTAPGWFALPWQRPWRITAKSGNGPTA